MDTAEHAALRVVLNHETDTKIKQLQEELARERAARGHTLAWDLGCTPPALVESSQLQKWNEARVSAGLDPLTTTYFDTPRKISGIGSEATTIIGTCSTRVLALLDRG